jgi:hypothetical protein
MNELGRELKPSELRLRTVVVVGREDRATMYTAWVHSVGDDYVALLAGEIATVFLAKRRPDDTLVDDTGKRVMVFEYLGEI